MPSYKYNLYHTYIICVISNLLFAFSVLIMLCEIFWGAWHYFFPSLIFSFSVLLGDKTNLKHFLNHLNDKFTCCLLCLVIWIENIIWKKLFAWFSILVFLLPYLFLLHKTFWFDLSTILMTCVYILYYEEIISVNYLLEVLSFDHNAFLKSSIFIWSISLNIFSYGCQINLQTLFFI